MNAFEEIEDQIKRQEQRAKAQELRQRIEALEKELDGPANQNPNASEAKVEVMPPEKSKVSKKWINAGKFVLLAGGVIVATFVAAWLARVVMIVAVVWIGYKLFLED